MNQMLPPNQPGPPAGRPHGTPPSPYPADPFANRPHHWAPAPMPKRESIAWDKLILAIVVFMVVAALAGAGLALAGWLYRFVSEVLGGRAGSGGLGDVSAIVVLAMMLITVVAIVKLLTKRR